MRSERIEQLGNASGKVGYQWLKVISGYCVWWLDVGVGCFEKTNIAFFIGHAAGCLLGVLMGFDSGVSTTFGEPFTSSPIFTQQS